MSRLTPERLKAITGRAYGKTQARWFREHLNADVPCDHLGPIMTEQTFEELVARASGVRAGAPAERPTVRLRTSK